MGSDFAQQCSIRALDRKGLKLGLTLWKQKAVVEIENQTRALFVSGRVYNKCGCLISRGLTLMRLKLCLTGIRKFLMAHNKLEWFTTCMGLPLVKFSLESNCITAAVACFEITAIDTAIRRTARMYWMSSMAELHVCFSTVNP